MHEVILKAEGLESEIKLVDTKVVEMEKGTDAMNKWGKVVKSQLKTANVDLGKMA